MKKQTAGRDNLGDLAPKFAELNDDILFGEIWSRENKLSLRDRSLITISALMAQGLYPQVKSHLILGKEHGLTKEEVIEVITQLAFYTGWAKAWSVFPIVREVYADEVANNSNSLFGLGEPNNMFAKYFKGNSYLKMLNTQGVAIANVTFEPKCRNHWHIHHRGGQILLCTNGEGWYQEFGKKAQRLKPGDVVYIAPEVTHWHGAGKDGWFTHLAIEIPAEDGQTEWLDEVSDQEYSELK